MCYQDIEEFRRQTNNSNFLRIFNKYFAEAAPFPVNLPEKTIRDIRLKEGILTRKTDLSDLQCSFDTARRELLLLMEGDTYQRFIKSRLFVGFCKGEKLPSADHDHKSRSAISSNEESYAPSKQSEEIEMLSNGIELETNDDYENKDENKDEIRDNTNITPSGNSADTEFGISGHGVDNSLSPQLDPLNSSSASLGRLASPTVLDRPSVSNRAINGNAIDQALIDDEYYIQ